MSKRVLLCLSHSIEEHDQLRLLAGLGYEVASIGGYIDPRHPHDPKRPALDIPFYPEVKDAVDTQGVADNLGAAQEHIPDAILDWLGKDGILIYHHYLERLWGQWGHLARWRKAGGRVIWRTVGQSVTNNERQAAPFCLDGLEIVRYSPKERNIPGFAGEDALIRFYKDPAEWQGWTGEKAYVLNITQHLRQREPYTNWGFWEMATKGLPRMPAGPGSEVIEGPGEMSFEIMQQSLREARVYLYTGTQPASYTLGLIEAMMTGMPVVSIGPAWMRLFPYGPALFEGGDLVAFEHALQGRVNDGFNKPDAAHDALRFFLEECDAAKDVGQRMRERAVELFGMDTIGAQWQAYLG
jgi:hypothetical protein